MGEGSEERRGGGEDRDVYRSDDFSHRTISTGAPARIPDRDCFYTCLSPSRENYDSDRASRFITSNQPAIKVTLRQEGEITRDNRKRSVSDQSIIGTSGFIGIHRGHGGGGWPGRVLRREVRQSESQRIASVPPPRMFTSGRSRKRKDGKKRDAVASDERGPEAEKRRRPFHHRRAGLESGPCL